MTSRKRLRRSRRGRERYIPEHMCSGMSFALVVHHSPDAGKVVNAVRVLKISIVGYFDYSLAECGIRTGIKIKLFVRNAGANKAKDYGAVRGEVYGLDFFARAEVQRLQEVCDFVLGKAVFRALFDEDGVEGVIISHRTAPFLVGYEYLCLLYVSDGSRHSVQNTECDGGWLIFADLGPCFGALRSKKSIFLLIFEGDGGVIIKEKICFKIGVLVDMLNNETVGHKIKQMIYFFF